MASQFQDRTEQKLRYAEVHLEELTITVTMTNWRPYVGRIQVVAN